MTDVFEMPVHPAAAVFPMLPDDDLDELAADIKANGLRFPLVVKDGQLIDGRNRREACRRAGIAPSVEELNGVDPITYIISTNINRRHLTKGQRAMAVAKLYPQSLEKGGRGKTRQINCGVSPELVRQARVVLQWLPEIADAVLAGTKPLNEAYVEAQRLKDQADAEPPRLARLRERAADLADLVDEGRMRLTEAESAYATREEARRLQRLATLEVLNGMERLLDVFAAGKRRTAIVEDLRQQSEDRRRATDLMTQWVTNLTETLEALT